MSDKKSAKIRLFVEHVPGQGQTLDLARDQAHYLFGVMRQGVGDFLLIFDGKSGEWLAQVAQAGKRAGVLTCVEQTKPQMNPPDLWLLFAPIKKARTDFIVEKAAEMGAARICPVATDFTNSERIRQDRLQAHAVEAAEQCGGTFVPQVTELQKLDAVLANWPPDRQLMFCDEALAGATDTLTQVSARTEGGREAPALGGGAGAHRAASDPVEELSKQPWAILIGPEGGFSAAERTRLHALPFAHAVSLGPRILRADTAAVAAMTVWQQALGDWA
ncbi:16S ribosomal RNA methyltransferase RsmE [Actibacterium atlanticum]|uniref:Ribosomal RNA small subunit methyltransferase E n=1 Tax=Actibacterium atlanticum TaxID=1461693 RepID=A0A058ZGR1_9RHOB|nr:16S rRNA (uracil(1498)-N(3))-methyltransferase [Actibacterium atlanticum]KCV80819.1 16S ribosomal RNA methyltransferase RsmE [Actibacterium atlanticum]